jgi:ABC-2 type transport system permease protein
MSSIVLLQRELRDAVRRFWFVVNAGVFVVSGLLLVLFGQPDAMLLGSHGYARSLAGLMHLAMVFVPLMALIPAAAAIAGEREAGTLDYLLAQPIRRSRIYLTKWGGTSAATAVSVAVGYAVVGLIAAIRGFPSGPIVVLLGCTVLLALAFVSLGLWISSMTGSRTRATSFALTTWLLLTGLGSLGIMSAFVQWGLPPTLLQAWSLLNPVEAYRLAGVVLLDPAATTVLGPVGAALFDATGRDGLIGLATVSLAGWAGAGFLIGRRVFVRDQR